MSKEKPLAAYKRHSKVPEITRAFKAYDKGTRDLFLLVFHKRHFIRARPFGAGFQPTPMECPKCKEMVMHPDDLLYDLASLPTKKRNTCEQPSRAIKLVRGLKRLVRVVEPPARRSRRK